ncbi:MAG: LLM class F420-dependent oxidoreductase [Actinomycetota bacterium]|nr:LLM class F420-dependent oxidoreductase [Actinomycetota bacterium]MDQ2958904.1 LLM class F420-dependent oxidoreductase [Actinomycetota bacterium]
MKLALHVSDFAYEGSPASTGATLAKIGQTAEQAGLESLTVMDHLFQISMVGPHEDPMLEAYTALGFLAGVTSEIKLGALVTAAVYRPPGLLIKAVTTLDVLSGGRAFLGIGAAWNEQEAVGLGLPFPPVSERFEKLEEVLQIARQMWSTEDGPFEGEHYHLGATVNSPQSLQRPHPPIMIGGGGEKKTLRLVAKYADACNIFSGPEAGHKLEVLREHCEREGRDYNEITKTTIVRFDLSDRPALIAQLHELHELGFTIAHGTLPRSDDFAALEALGAIAAEVAGW